MTAIARAPRRAHAGHGRRHNLRSASHLAARRTRRRVALVLGLLPLLSGLVLGSAVAERAPAVSHVSSTDAAQAGEAIVIETHGDLAPGLTEVTVPAPISATRASGTDQLLALAPDAGTVAVAGQVGVESTPLILARADGSQLQVELPGLIAAAFAPDQSWLAAIDGRGALWRIAAADGAAQLVAAGPFIGEPVIQADGSVIALQVPSVEAPYRSSAVRISAAGAMTALTDEGLVYAVQILADGSVALTAHRATGTVVLRLNATGGKATTLANVGPDAVNVAIAPGAEAVAWESGGDIFLRRLSAGGPQRIGAGSHPRFSPDGQALLVDLPTGTQLVDPDGSLVATFSTQLDFAACAAACGS